MKPKLLFLFADGWDRTALADAHALRAQFTIVHEGFDLFRAPGNARILWFDAPRWIDRLVARYAGAGVAGVVSTHEQYGALIAAQFGDLYEKVDGTHPYTVLADFAPRPPPRCAAVMMRVAVRQGIVTPTVKSAALSPSSTNSPQ